MDPRIPFLLLFAAVIAVFAVRARRSGEITLHVSQITREEQPALFNAALTVRWLFVALAVGGACAVALGLIPLSRG